jgi:flagellar protein FliL
VTLSTAALHESHGAAQAAAEAGKKGKAKGKGRKLIILAAVVVLLAAGGFVAWTKLAGAATPEPDPAKTPGAVEKLDSMTLNLADGHYLKVGMALQLSKKASPAAAGAAAESSTTSTFDGAKAQDAAIAVFGQRTYAQLLAPGGRAKAQAALTSEISKRYDGGVLHVYLTEFLMQ